MGKKQMHFEQIPVEIVKKITAGNSREVSGAAAACAICGQHVGVENSNTDEHGRAVHEACYVARLRHSRVFHSS